MNKLVKLFLCLILLTGIIFADDTETEDPDSDDPLYNYHHDIYDESISGDKNSRASYFDTDVMCQVVVDESDIQNYDSAVIHEFRSNAKAGQIADNDSTGEMIQYYFNAKNIYFGLYDEVSEAKEACKLIFNTANNVKKALWDGNREFSYVAEGTTGGTHLLINKDCINPSKDSDNCSISSVRTGREEALNRFFQIINKYYPHIKESWKNEKPTPNQEYENYLDEVIYRSIIAEYANSVFNVELSNGDVINFGGGAAKDRRILNNKVYKNQSGRVSAYQRFGPNIRFVPYFGEQSFSIETLDKIVSAVAQGKMSTISDIKSALETSSTYVSTTVYPNRAPVLNNSDIKKGLSDPRVNAFGLTGAKAGADASIGNMYLGISKILVAIINAFLGDEIVTLLWELVESLETSSIWTILIVPALSILTTFGMVFFIISLVNHGRKYGFGREDARPFMGRLFGGILTLGILAILAINPTSLNKIPRVLTTFVDEVIEYTMMNDATVKSDDVVYSEDTDGFMSAAVWKKSIFEPWCEGTFQTDYDHLWTYYSGHSESHQMPQSHDETHESDENGNVTFDSAGMTGDIGVPLGGEYTSKNWAIFAWSTQSIFHIDSNENRYFITIEDSDEQEMREEVSWPNAFTTYGNKNIYADAFKWIDAKLNISYQYGENGHRMPNYTDAKGYVETFKSAGRSSLYMSLLLLLITPTIIEKYTQFTYLLIITIRIMVAAIQNLFKEKSFTKVFPEYVDHFKAYLVASIKLGILVILYYNLASIYSVANTILFAFLAITIQLVNIQNLRKAKYTVDRYLEEGAVDSNRKERRVAIIDMNIMENYQKASRLKDDDWKDVAPNPKAAAEYISKMIASDPQIHQNCGTPDFRIIAKLCDQREKEVREANKGKRDVIGILYEDVNFQIRWADYKDKSSKEDT